MKKALVTGSEGFVGKHFVNILEEEGYQVKGFDIKSGQDIRDREALEEAAEGVDVIFNLASLLGTHELIEERVYEAVEVTTGGAVNVFEVAKKNKIEVVHIGKKNVWLNTYTITKQASEDFAKMYHKEFNIPIWIVKWLNIFGPGQHYGYPQKIGPTFVVKALRGEDIPIFGTGEQTVDLIYVTDAVRAAIALYESGQGIGVPVEIGSGIETTVNYFADKVIEMTDSKSKKVYSPMRRGETKMSHIYAELDNFEEFTDFEPRVGLEEGLKKTIDYYRERLDDIPEDFEWEV